MCCHHQSHLQNHYRHLLTTFESKTLIFTTIHALLTNTSIFLKTCNGPLPPNSGTGVRDLSGGRGHAPGAGGRSLFLPKVPSGRSFLVSRVTLTQMDQIIVKYRVKYHTLNTKNHICIHENPQNCLFLYTLKKSSHILSKSNS